MMTMLNNIRFFSLNNYMSEYEFIKKCTNYNIKKSKGWKYETVVKWAMNEIKRIDNRQINYVDYIGRRMVKKFRFDYENVEIVDGVMTLTLSGRHDFGKLYKYNIYYLCEQERDFQKFKMSVHYLKTKLPDALVLNIGSFL